MPDQQCPHVQVYIDIHMKERESICQCSQWWSHAMLMDITWMNVEIHILCIRCVLPNDKGDAGSGCGNTERIVECLLLPISRQQLKNMERQDITINTLSNRPTKCVHTQLMYISYCNTCIYVYINCCIIFVQTFIVDKYKTSITVCIL